MYYYCILHVIYQSASTHECLANSIMALHFCLPLLLIKFFFVFVFKVTKDVVFLKLLKTRNKSTC